jgi:Raf kinase inhibitor-like YbhB/YbcL family protein
MHFLTTTFIILAIIMSSFSPNDHLTVTSTSFDNNGMIPAKFSCEGAEASPPLHIGNIPATAKSLAIIVHDPDAPIRGGFTHWVVWNIETDGNIPENFQGGMQGLNDAKTNGYKGMCPPSGTHHYHFMVYALDSRLNIDKNTNKATLEKSIANHIVATGELTGLYKKQGK